MKIKISCPNCETDFSITSKEEPQFCCFCGENIKLYNQGEKMLDYKLSADEDLDEDDLFEDDEDLDEDDEDLDEDDDLDEDEDEEYD